MTIKVSNVSVYGMLSSKVSLVDFISLLLRALPHQPPQIYSIHALTIAICKYFKLVVVDISHSPGDILELVYYFPFLLNSHFPAVTTSIRLSAMG